MQIFERITSVYAPHCCIVCRKEGAVLCDWCLPDVRDELPSVCYRCNCITTDFSVCPVCRRTSRLKHVWIASRYTSILRELIKGFKYERKRDSAKAFARISLEVLPYLDDYVVVPMPTVASRVRRRGFDHAYLLAREVSRGAKLSFSPILSRLDHEQQVGKSRRERLKSTIEIIVRGNVVGQKILLVDDVVTTGASLEAAARVLRASGAKEVSAVVCARNK